MVEERPDEPSDLDDLLRWSSLLEESVSEITRAHGPDAAMHARRIVAQAAGVELSDWHTVESDLVTTGSVHYVRSLVARRVAGEPLQYVLGSWGFRTLDLIVDHRVLIPRPETESTVEVALGLLDRWRDRRPGAAQVLDLGTGSGAIALSIAAERVWTRVVATDASADALAVARANLAGLGRAATRVELAQGSWFDALGPAPQSRFDLIVSNPPYVCDGDELDPVVAEWEPNSALRAGPDGLDDLVRIVDDAPKWLLAGGALVLELDPRQVDAVADRAERAGLVEVQAHCDLAGRQRIIAAMQPE